MGYLIESAFISIVLRKGSGSMTDTFVSTIIQCAILIGIPWIAYLVFSKERIGFFGWIGLYKPTSNEWIKTAIVIFLISIIIMAVPLFLFIRLGSISEEMLSTMNLGSKGVSLEIIAIVLTKAIFQTALSEEVLFRGFIGKRIQKKFGFIWGNVVQAILFGLPHGLPFILVYKAYVFGIVFFLSAATVGFLQFYLNEKKANGSILPSLLIHSTLNIISFF